MFVLLLALVSSHVRTRRRTFPKDEITNDNIQAKIDAVGYAEAKFRRAQGNSDPARMEKIGWGDCWASSFWLFNHLSKIGVKVRIVQCTGGSYPLHRWAQINVGNGWVNWPYAKYNSKHIGQVGSAYHVYKTSA